MDVRFPQTFFSLFISVLLCVAAVLIRAQDSPARQDVAHRLETAGGEFPVVSQSQESPAYPGAFWSVGTDEETADKLLSAMSDKEIVAQCFLVGWPTEHPAAGIMEWIRSRGIGGVKVFGWNGGNPDILAQTVATFQTAEITGHHGIPLLVATDQEGGIVRHIRGDTSITPGNMAIGASGLPYDAYRTGFYIGRELRAIGVNMNFAPDIDVIVNPKDRVIGPRAFSSDPVKVGILGIAYMRGLDQAHVIATAKHFPGHGNAAGDSHGMLPVIPDTFETVWNRDLLPYRMLISAGLPAILGGHLNFPRITGDDAPASLSRYFKTVVMREKLGFKGVVITDDMYMEGALIYGDRHHLSFGQLCLLALKAGNDMIMLSRTPGIDDEVWRTIYNAYENDPQSRTIIRAAVRRVLLMKLKYLKPAGHVPFVPDVTALKQALPDRNGENFFRDQAARGITVIRDAWLPLEPRSGKKVLLAGDDQTFLQVGKKAYPDASLFRFNSTADAAALVAAASRADTVVFCLSDPYTIDLLNDLRGIPAHVVVFSILTPMYLREAPWVQSAIAVYGWGIESYDAGFAALAGGYRPTGKLPIDLLWKGAGP
ncbi:MAG TPA: glycoside hydrolase family 3 protein [Spirochaetia bacterium]|nr:glycoside hydrolase family 3 protein [Spirochaetia bacterium]